MSITQTEIDIELTIDSLTFNLLENVLGVLQTF